MQITRRNFMIYGLATAISQDKTSLLSKREIDQLIKALQKANAQGIPGYIQSLKELGPLLEFDRKYLEKYGFANAPKVFINPDFQYRPFVYDDSRAAPIAKDDKYMDILFDLYREIRLLDADLRNYSSQYGNPDDLLPDLDLLAQNPLLRRTFIIDSSGRTVNIGSAHDLVSFIQTVAISDVEAANSDMASFALYDYFALVDSLRKSAPQMISPLKDASSVGGTLEELLSGLVPNYRDASPVLVVYADEKDFEEKTGQKGTAAFHRPFTDTLETYGKERFVNIFELSHEVGHVLARNQEGGIADRIRSLYRTISAMYTLIVERQNAMEMLAMLKKEKNPQKIAEMNDEIRTRLTGIRRITGLLNLQALASKIEQLSEFFGSAHGDFLDETAAYLFQDIVLTHFAHASPQIGAMMLQYRDLRSTGQDREHYGAYMLARELRKKHNGDSLTAFREIAYLADREKIEAYIKKIEEYNDEKFGSKNTGIFARLETLRKRIDIGEKVRNLSEEWRLHQRESAYAAVANQRILQTQSKVADLFAQYAKLTMRAPN